jgi:hypothetical protein
MRIPVGHGIEIDGRGGLSGLGSLLSWAGRAALAALLASCTGPPESSVNPGKVAVAVPSDAPNADPNPDPNPLPIKAYQGTVTMMDGCGVGVVRVASDYADIDTFVAGAVQSSQRWLRQGQLTVVCGALHRVLGLSFEEGQDVPGNTGRALVLDGHPDATVALQSGSAVLTLDGIAYDVGPAHATLKGLSITMQEGRAVARLRVSLNDGSSSSVVGGPGDLIEIAGEDHRIVDVEPTDLVRGVPGWIEIGSTSSD